MHLLGAGSPSYPGPKGWAWGGSRLQHITSNVYRFFTKDLSVHGNNYVTEQKYPPIKEANLPYRGFYRGHELKAAF